MTRGRTGILTSMVTVAALTASTAAAASGAAGRAVQRFPDVPRDHWAYEEVHYLRADGMLEGWGDRYHGNSTFTRYEMAEVLERYMTRYHQVRGEIDRRLGALEASDQLQAARLRELEAEAERLLEILDSGEGQRRARRHRARAARSARRTPAPQPPEPAAPAPVVTARVEPAGPPPDLSSFDTEIPTTEDQPAPEAGPGDNGFSDRFSRFGSYLERAGARQQARADGGSVLPSPRREVPAVPASALMPQPEPEVEAPAGADELSPEQQAQVAELRARYLERIRGGGDVPAPSLGNSLD